MEDKIDLSEHHINVETVWRNIAPAKLYEEALRYEKGSAISDTGALVVSSGAKTGRSPGDKRIVDHPDTTGDIWWGSVNIKLQEHTFMINHERAIDYLNTCERLYVIDGFAGWDPSYRMKIRIICTRAYHALFMHNMLIRPTKEELSDFGEPDFTIYNAGRFPANRYTSEMTSTTSIDLSFERREMVILGTEYAGEMKKGVFTVMNYLMPKRGQVSMHCSANRSADGRELIGDDEHVWTDKGIFNIEGGCYAKCIDLSAEKEPEIYAAIRFGSVLENVVYDEDSRHVDYADGSKTENTRVAYPIEYIPNAAIPCIGEHPENIIFLTCDAFGVLPPVSRLSPAQAMYHFISGYTAKVAGTEMGVTEPEATFSACFGAAFMVWHPSKYAELLAEQIRKNNSKVWLVNTGWSGGGYGVGERFSLKYTRAIIDAIHSGALDQAATVVDANFGFAVLKECPGVPSNVMVPRAAWADGSAYDEKATLLAGLFKKNFEKFAKGASEEIQAAGPV
jgi:phosphoenolpyruvate carboxykinase (ATP)